jgi:predicted MFS family arabinose efflux permease
MACGAGHGSLFPVLNALSVSRAPAHLHGVVISLHTASLDLGGVVGTPLCGAIARTFGYRAMFGTVAAGALVGLSIMLWDRRRRA